MFGLFHTTNPFSLHPTKHHWNALQMCLWKCGVVARRWRARSVRNRYLKLIVLPHTSYCSVCHVLTTFTTSQPRTGKQSSPKRESVHSCMWSRLGIWRLGHKRCVPVSISSSECVTCSVICMFSGFRISLSVVYEGDRKEFLTAKNVSRPHSQVNNLVSYLVSYSRVLGQGLLLNCIRLE